MTIIGNLGDAERWRWFAGGDGTIAPAPPSARTGNEPERVLFEMGLVVAAPLALAALATLIFGA